MEIFYVINNVPFFFYMRVPRPKILDIQNDIPRHSIIAIYLPPEKVSFIDARSTMYFWAEELHDEAKYVFFAREEQRRGQKWNIWPRVNKAHLLREVDTIFY